MMKGNAKNLQFSEKLTSPQITAQNTMAMNGMAASRAAMS